MNFQNILIRCSSLSCLFTEPQSKADREAGLLSKTAKTHLIEVYARELWGMEKDIVTKQMRKGIEAEEQGIALLSIIDGIKYSKNEERLENDYISGHADVVHLDTVTDLKISWDAFTFLPKLIEEVDKCYYYQVQGYMWLWDKPKARISYALVNTPDNIIEGEKYRLLRSMDVVSEESPEYIKAARKLENNMKFDRIPIHQRVIHHYVDRNDDIINMIPSKVEKAREFLHEIYNKHHFLINQTEIV